jgi:hypothetical protein
MIAGAATDGIRDCDGKVAGWEGIWLRELASVSSAQWELRASQLGPRCLRSWQSGVHIDKQGTGVGPTKALIVEALWIY